MHHVSYISFFLPDSLPQEQLFLHTVMMIGGPPPRPGLRGFKEDGEHEAYFRRAVSFWKEQGCRGSQWDYMVFYNQEFIRWLNQNQAGR